VPRRNRVPFALCFTPIAGEAPFRDKSKKALYRRILGDKVVFPRFLSAAAVSLIKGLLERK
jgi:hypothetical protein